MPLSSLSSEKEAEFNYIEALQFRGTGDFVSDFVSGLARTVPVVQREQREEEREVGIERPGRKEQSECARKKE